MKEGKLRRPKRLLEALRLRAGDQSPEATANFWTFAAGIGPEGFRELDAVPASIPPMSDLSEVTVDGLELDNAFGGTLVILSGAEFSDCALSNNAFEQCDFLEAGFSGCRLRGVSFRFCFGPITFENCEFESCVFEDMQARDFPALIFSGCTFDGKTRIVQKKEIGGSTAYGAIASFEDCEGSRPLFEIVEGEMIGFDPRRTAGYTIAGGGEQRPAADECLRAILKPFFPRRAGATRQLQARPYIRSSAVGRGRLPAGSPTGDTLIGILYSAGFTDGGREGHVYAPWSSVAGARDSGVELRNELLAFLLDGQQGNTVRQLIQKVQQAASWRR